MAKIQPITPQEVTDKKIELIPDVVIEVFNELITKNYCGKIATVQQDEVIDLICSKNPAYTREQIFENHWLDVEDIYRKIGWSVLYDKPGWNETYEPYFVFKKRESD